MPVAKGYLAMVLHAHLPYVRHLEEDTYLEENWFFEALTESYIPLIDVFDGLIRDNVDFRITISLSPPLICMMTDPMLQHRYLKRLHKLIELAEKEVIRTEGQPEYHRVAQMYLEKFKGIRKTYVDKYRMDLVKAFKQLRDSGKVEIITSCATHGYLPLMLTKQAVRAQVKTAVDLFVSVFGTGPRGIWLPECGFSPGVDEILKEFGIKYFFVDTHGLLYATPRPYYGVHAPLYTPAGVAAFGRDVETSRQVWDMQTGYPGDFYYREFYRDVGYDLDIDYIGPYIFQNRIRIDTGIKYYRITGKTNYKEPYQPDIARDKAAEHAGNFMFNREKQIEHLAANMDREPIIVAPYDAELFGHWWYEGPQWLDFLLRKICYDQDTFKTITPWEYLNKYPNNQVAKLPMSSWGHKGFNEVWLDPANDWIYRHLHQAEERMLELANMFPQAGGLYKRALNQAARELLLAQSSDWAFIMKMQTAVDYAVRRTRDHIAKFNRLYWAIKEERLNEEEISALEAQDSIFSNIDYRMYSHHSSKIIPFPLRTRNIFLRHDRILMLSWEFPPKTVGGLARHVYDLSRALVRHGQEVHVITCHVPGCKDYEVVEGVHVYRLDHIPGEQEDFLRWVFKMNEAMAEKAAQVIKSVGKFDLIHAHDWLVAHAGKTLKHEFNIPLVATVHATEYGRNHGLHNDMQRYINDVEWGLTYEAWKVICCSKYMAAEIAQIFQLPGDKIRIIPNGVDVANITPAIIEPGFRNKYALPEEKIVYFVGRLVPEKGVQVLLEAVPVVLNQYPNAKFIISGKGPYGDHLKWLADQLGVAGKVFFTGFTDDDTRNKLLHAADVAVFPSLYEPFGIVALEAMAAHTPVIVSETGGLGEVIEHEVDGLKFYPGDFRALAHYIVTLLKDEALAKRLDNNAWDKVTKIYNWDIIARDTMEVYHEILRLARATGYIS